MKLVQICRDGLERRIRRGLGEYVSDRGDLGRHCSITHARYHVVERCKIKVLRHSKRSVALQLAQCSLQCTKHWALVWREHSLPIITRVECHDFGFPALSPRQRAELRPAWKGWQQFLWLGLRPLPASPKAARRSRDFVPIAVRMPPA